MSDVSVVIGTYGDTDWASRAQSEAAPSVPEGIPVIHRHGLTLADARNEALHLVTTEWVIHLDADDRLTPDYVDQMAKGDADVRAPVVDFEPGGIWRPRVGVHSHWCEADCLPEGNWIVIGAMARTQLLRDVGGWRDFALYEDWDLWLRCWRAGATFEWAPDAIYIAQHRLDSRNRAPGRRARLAAHQAIHDANHLDLECAKCGRVGANPTEDDPICPRCWREMEDAALDVEVARAEYEDLGLM